MRALLRSCFFPRMWLYVSQWLQVPRTSLLVLPSMSLFYAILHSSRHPPNLNRRACVFVVLFYMSLPHSSSVLRHQSVNRSVKSTVSFFLVYHSLNFLYLFLSKYETRVGGQFVIIPLPPLFFLLLFAHSLATIVCLFSLLLSYTMPFRTLETHTVYSLLVHALSPMSYRL